MKFFLQCLILGFLFIGTLACASDSAKNKKNPPPIEYAQKVKNKFPAFETFLCTLDSIYDYGLDKEYLYSIAKQPEGYFLEVFTYEKSEKQFKEFIQLWDYKKNTYSKNALRSYKNYDSKPYGFYNRHARDIQKYDFHLFYGYDDYFDDVFNFYEGKPNLSDEDYEILARAHDTKSMSYIHNGIWGSKSTLLKGNEDPYYSKLKKERVDGFIDNLNLTQKYLKLIQKRNPNYKTHLIGDVNLKIANNYVHMYQTLISIREKSLAMEYLNMTNYKTEYINMAKNYLDYCDLNSFLFSHGDSDSFPLWYVQEVMNYRKDVHVYNLSLLGTPWYQKMIRERDNLNLKLDIDQANQYKCFSMYFTGPEPVSDIIENFNQNIFNYDGYTIDSLHKAVISFNYKGEDINLYNREYIFDLSKLFVLDVIKNYPNRSIQYTSNYQMPTENIKNHFMVYEISNQENAKQIFDSRYVSKIQEQLSTLNKLEYNSVASFRQQMTSFIELGNYYVSEKDNPKLEIFVKELFSKTSDGSLIKNREFYNLILKYIFLSHLDSNTAKEIIDKSKVGELLRTYVNNIEFSRDSYTQDLFDLRTIKYFFQMSSDIESAEFRTLNLDIAKEISNKIQSYVNSNVLKEYPNSRKKLEELNEIWKN